MKCVNEGCTHEAYPNASRCYNHQRARGLPLTPSPGAMAPSMSQKYPKYYKDVTHKTEVDVYAIHHLFDIQDPSGAIQHASKKLLLSGVRTGGKSKFQDIKEARDTLNRWLEINPET